MKKEMHWRKIIDTDITLALNDIFIDYRTMKKIKKEIRRLIASYMRTFYKVYKNAEVKHV